MVEEKSPTERKQERESLLVGRDKASGETVSYLNQLRTQIDDPQAAEGLAMLHAQINGDHDDYERPPDQQPFGNWHHSLTVDAPTVVSTGTTSATVGVTLSEFHLYDPDATIHVRFIKQTDTPDSTVIETPTQTLTDTGTLQFNTDSLERDTKYDVQAVATAEVDVQSETVYSNKAELKTDL